MSLISIVIPTYNSCKHIDETLKSFKNNLEVYLFLKNSKKEILESWKKNKI